MNKLQQGKNLYGKYRVTFFSCGIFEMDIGQERIVFECSFLLNEIFHVKSVFLFKLKYNIT